MKLTGTEDLRVRRTLEAIRRSFESLLLEKDYEKITVTELAERAMINKKTFYTYYQSLDDLLTEIQDEVLEIFRNYAWPGNVRELFHVLDYARNVADDDVLRPEHLPPYMKRTVGPAESSSREAAGPGEHHDFSRDTLQDIMDEYEHRVLMEALEHFGYNITKTAEALGLRRQSLQYRIRKYGIHI